MDSKQTETSIKLLLLPNIKLNSTHAKYTLN